MLDGETAAAEPRGRRRRVAVAGHAHYHETLKQSPEAQQYLVKRGLTSSEMIEHFQLGFANRTLGYRLPQKTASLARNSADGCNNSASSARTGTNT